MGGIVLNGITWGHSRGITPLQALSQRYSELYPGVEIKWEKRTLQEFADYPIEKLTETYDLLIIDHPWVGCAAASNCVLPLDQYLSKEYLKDQLDNSVGQSHKSYNYNGHQWALAVDAAAPAASYRKSLLKQNNISVPQTWEEVLDLAKAGKVAVPGIPIDLLMNFYSFCLAYGKEPFQNDQEVTDTETGIKAIETMKQLYSVVDKKMFQHNPIAVAELMTTTNDYWYCPFAYCYSNYSREGYADHLLHYTDVVSFNRNKLRTTIGGTGLAVSAFSQHKETTIDFAAMVSSARCQRTMYVQSGGQPAHRSAWMDESANYLTNNFFKIVLPVMENGYLRPRYNGYLHFQDHAGEPLHKCLIADGDPEETLKKINKLYRQSIAVKKSTVEV
jgi:multiple sugar transport system substrate-binding protein